MKHLITRFIVLATAICSGISAFAGAALTIGDVNVTPSSGPLYANDENRITNLSYEVSLTNSGDTDLAPGNDGYSVTLVYSSKSIDLQTIDITTPIAAGETATVTFNWDFSMDPISATEHEKPNFWARLDIRENVTGTTKSVNPWRDIYESSTGYALVGETSNIEIDKTINFGFVTEPTSMNFRIRATGTKNVTVNSIELPEGFSMEPATPFTVTGLASATASSDCFQPVTLTFNPVQPGVKAGNLKVNVEGSDAKMYPVSGAFIGENSFFESFDGEGGSDYQPKGWVLSDHWSVKWNNTSDNDKYVLAHSSADTPNFDFAISPKLHFSEGESMTFEAAKRSTSSILEVYYSTDRSNWILLKTINNNGNDGAESFPAQTETLETYVLSGIPAGEWYIGFKGMYVYLNNVFGGERATVEHDAIILSSEFPAKATVNNPYNVSVTAKNLSDNTESAGNYSVKLIAGGKVVAEAETPEWAPLTEQTFNMSYTPHEAGDVDLQCILSLPGIELSTVPMSVTVNPESASYSVTVGTATSTNDAYIPLRTNYYNSESQSIYTEEFLAQYGILPGTQITGLSYDARSSNDIDIATTLTIWMKKVNESTIDAGTPYDLTEDTPVFNDSYTLALKDKGNEPYELINASFGSGFVYEGGNLLISVRSSNASAWKGSSFEVDSELKNNSINRCNDNYNSFLTAKWSLRTGVPVVRFSIYAEPTKLQGTVTDVNGNPIGNTVVSLRSGDVTYSATTDEQGAYAIEVFQPDLVYTVTIDNPDHPVYSREVSFAGEQPDGNIVLEEFSTEREYDLTVKVTSSTEESLEGKPFTLVSDRFSITYPVSETKLDANGSASLKVYGGAHTVTLAVAGMKTVTETFSVNKATTIELAITEDVKTPFGASVELSHDIFSGKNTATLTWNRDEAVFAEDFEGMEPFAINLTPWTGIDGDNAAPIIMQGAYANAGVPCYAQVINPMAVDPIWDPVVYPTLTANSGMQYAGFPDLANRADHNDWLITPAVTLGEENVLRFSIKSADQTNARFTVGITTTENPTASDFEIISEGNYIEAGFENWSTFVIPLSAYAGQTVKVGFHCITPNGAFISQLDDVFIGRLGVNPQGKARRVPQHSAANPNEKFVIKLDGQIIGETTDYEYVFQDVLPGEHTATIIATYLNAEAEPVNVEFAIDADNFVKTDFAVSTNNGIVPEAMTITLKESEGDNTYAVPVSNGAASVTSLPKGSYDLTLTQDYYEPYATTIDVTAESTVNVLLKENIVAPFNITHEETGTHDGLVDVTLFWNRNLGFTDGFESYDDFATGSFGGWTTVDNNMEPSYPIGLGGASNIVSFPGCSTPTAPASVPPMVFNPNSTTPSMASDKAVAAPEGVKTIIFQGPQGAVADKWLISQKITIREDYEMSLLAKAYAIYPEKLELCISTTGTDAADFTILDEIQPAQAQWTLYSLPLTEYAGQEAYVAVHCVSNDGFIVQVDDFKVGRQGGEETAVAGYVQNYDITHNGESAGNTTETEILLTDLTDGSHTVGIKANYASGSSEITTYQFELSGHGAGGVGTHKDAETCVNGGDGEIIITSGENVDVVIVNALGVVVTRTEVCGYASIPADAGIYIVITGENSSKVLVR